MGLSNGLANPESYGATLGVLHDAMVTDGAEQSLKDGLVSENSKFPGHLSSRLLMHHVYMDWRDMIARIDIPTFCVGGDVSNVPANCVPYGPNERSFSRPPNRYLRRHSRDPDGLTRTCSPPLSKRL